MPIFKLGVWFQCDIAYHRSVAVLCMLYKIRCNTMHTRSLWCSTWAVCASAGFTRCMVAQRYIYALPRFRTSQYTITFTLLSVSLWNYLGIPVLDGVGLGVSRARQMPFYFSSYLLPFCLLLYSFSLLSFYGLVLWGFSIRTDRVLIALSQPCIASFCK